LGAVVRGEWLCTFVHERGDDSDTVTLVQLRYLNPADVEASTAGSDLLAFVTTQNALHELFDAGRDLLNEVESLGAAPSATQRRPGAGRTLERRFKAWLSAFRSFDDHANHWLSGRYGQQSEQVEAFKRLLNAEFDSNFAYRFCSSVRNIGQHAGSVVNELSFSSRGREAGAMFLRMDCARLITEEDKKKKVRAKSRQEMLAIPRLLELLPLVEAAVLSCNYAFARLVRSLKPEVDSALDHVRDCLDQAHAVGGATPFFAPEHMYDPTDIPTRCMLTSRSLPAEVLTEWASCLSVQVEQIESFGSRELSWEAFATDEPAAWTRHT
jgi:hypothetical protein